MALAGFEPTNFGYQRPACYHQLTEATYGSLLVETQYDQLSRKLAQKLQAVYSMVVERLLTPDNQVCNLLLPGG
jgi:hypothetical protein